MERNDILARTLKHNKEMRLNRKSNIEKSEHTDKTNVRRVMESKERRKNIKNTLKAPDSNLSVYNVAISNKERKIEDLDSILEKNKSLLHSVHNKITCTKENNKNILSMLPDIAMAVEIIISCILDPNKMSDSQLEYSFNNDVLLGAESLRSKLLDTIISTVDDEYHLTEKLPSILYEALAIAGSSPHMFIHESSAADLINSDLLVSLSTEEFQKNIGSALTNLIAPIGIFKGLQKEVALNVAEPTLENFLGYLTSSSLLSFNDNVNALSVNNIKTSLRKKIVAKASRRGTKISVEDHQRLEYLSGFRIKEEDHKFAAAITDKKEASRKGVGRPLLIKLPPESVTNIFAPGNPNEPLGHLILLDENYVPIGSTVGESTFNRMNNNLHGKSNQFVNTPINQVYRDMIDATGDNKTCVDVNALYGMYKEIVDEEILKSMESSLYDEHIELANREEIYYIMFCRALEARKTNVLYVPAENLVYYSLMNNEMGIGKTLLEDHMILYSLRILLLFAKTMAYVKQSIDITDINIELDPRDPNAEESFEMMKEIILKMRSNMLPVGDIDPQRITQWVQQAGLKFNVTGHPDMPEMNVTYSNGTMDHTVPDSDLDEMLAKKSITSLKLSPEMVDEAFSNNFAVEAMIKNSLVNKQFKKYQRMLEPHNTKFVRNIIYNDENLRAELKEIFEEELRSRAEFQKLLTEDEKSLLNKDKDAFFEMYLDKISDNITVSLPSIVETETDQALKEFEGYVDRTKAVLDIVLSDEMFDSEHAGEANGNLNSIKALLLAILVKRWASTNNYMPEVFSIIAEDDETIKATIGSAKGHYTAVFKNIIDLLGSITDVRVASDDDLAAIKGKIERLTKINEDKRQEEENEEE